MAKDLIAECTLPAPIKPPATGNAKADAALAKLQVWELWSSDPNDRPYGDDYEKACKAATAAGYHKLLPLLDDPGLFEVGRSVWDETRHNKLSPAKKKEYSKVSEAAGHARKGRVGYILFLVEAVIPEGYKRLLEIARDKDIAPDVCEHVLTYLTVNLDDKKRLLEIAKAYDIAKWPDYDGAKDLAVACLSAWNKADPKGCFDTAKAWVTAAAATKNAERADAVLSMIYREGGKCDPRWAVAIAPLAVGEGLDVSAVMALEVMPVDSAIVAPMVSAIGDLSKRTYFWDNLITVVARAATMDAVPLLCKMIAANAQKTEQLLGDITDTKVRAAVEEALGAQPKSPAKDKARSRPTLKFKKLKPLKAPKLGSFKEQEAEWRSMFEKAGIPKAFSIAQRAVALIPKRVDEATMKVGITKLGGHPDLHAKVAWPRVAKAPLTFVAQLKFADFAPLLPGAVPKAGTLAIFVDDDSLNEGGEYLTNARAIFSKPGTKLERREVPEDYVASIYQACTVDLYPKLSLPSPSNAHVTKALDEDTLEIYSDQVFVNDEAYCQVLGYRDCGYDAEEPATAQHLLQLIGDSQTDMEFGDADYLSFFVDEKRLRKGDWSKIWPRCGE